MDANGVSEGIGSLKRPFEPGDRISPLDAYRRSMADTGVLERLTRRSLRERPSDASVLGLDGEEADRVFDALGSETTRRILALIYEEPRSPSDLAAATGTTLQNVTYHLGKLRDAELIEPAMTHYSEKGQPVISYGPTREAVVVVAGPSSLRGRIGEGLARLGLLAVGLGLASVAAGRLVARWAAAPLAGAGDAVGDGDADAGVEALARSAEAAGAAGVDPALAASILFFLGGLFVVVVLGAWWLRRTWRS